MAGKIRPKKNTLVTEENLFDLDIGKDMDTFYQFKEREKIGFQTAILLMLGGQERKSRLDEELSKLSRTGDANRKYLFALAKALKSKEGEKETPVHYSDMKDAIESLRSISRTYAWPLVNFKKLIDHPDFFKQVLAENKNIGEETAALLFKRMKLPAGKLLDEQKEQAFLNFASIHKAIEDLKYPKQKPEDWFKDFTKTMTAADHRFEKDQIASIKKLRGEQKDPPAKELKNPFYTLFMEHFPKDMEKLSAKETEKLLQTVEFQRKEYARFLDKEVAPEIFAGTIIAAVNWKKQDKTLQNFKTAAYDLIEEERIFAEQNKKEGQVGTKEIQEKKSTTEPRFAGAIIQDETAAEEITPKMVLTNDNKIGHEQDKEGPADDYYEAAKKTEPYGPAKPVGEHTEDVEGKNLNDLSGRKDDKAPSGLPKDVLQCVLFEDKQHNDWYFKEVRQDALKDHKPSTLFNVKMDKTTLTYSEIQVPVAQEEKLTEEQLCCIFSRFNPFKGPITITGTPEFKAHVGKFLQTEKGKVYQKQLNITLAPDPIRMHDQANKNVIPNPNLTENKRAV